MHDLGTLGKDPSTANALNDQGQVVGASGTSGRKRHAFLWQNSRLYDLNTLVAANDYSGWELREAYGINNRGQIVCVGADKQGQTAALLLMPDPQK